MARYYWNRLKNKWVPPVRKPFSKEWWAWRWERFTNHFYILAIDYYRQKFMFELRRFFTFVGRSFLVQRFLFILEHKEFEFLNKIRDFLSFNFQKLLLFFQNNCFCQFFFSYIQKFKVISFYHIILFFIFFSLSLIQLLWIIHLFYC